MLLDFAKNAESVAVKNDGLAVANAPENKALSDIS